MKKIKYILFFFLILSNISNAQWVQMSNGLGNRWINVLALNGTTIFAGSSDSGVFISTNYGMEWSKTTLNNKEVLSFTKNNFAMFAGTGLDGVFYSTNNGQNWNQTAQISAKIISLFSNNNNLYAGTLYGIYFSSNNGSNWSKILDNNRAVQCIFISSNNLLAGIYPSNPPWVPPEEILYSTNNGLAWLETSMNGCPLCFASFNDTVYAGMSCGIVYGIPGIYISINNGINWLCLSSLNGNFVKSLSIYNNHRFAAIFENGVIHTSNNFANWNKINQGLLDTNVNDLLISGNYLFASTHSKGVFRRPLSEIASLNNEIFYVQEKYSLSQNYPNPFNPVTSIKFDIPKTSNILLKVFDITGKEISTLINEKLQPGTYETQWNASEFPSGVYFYRLEAGNYRETKKMILIK